MSGRDCLSLADLPLAWLFRFSTFLTAEAASRLRSTCTLLQKVVDATWEPAEVPVAPHRRSVPLTFEQVKAQLPPHKPWPQEWLEGPEEPIYPNRPEQIAWIDDFAAAAAATLDPLIEAAIAADSDSPAEEGVGASSSSSITSSAAAPGQQAGCWSEVSPRFSVLDCLPTRPGDRYMFDASACDSAQLQQIAQQLRPLVQEQGSSSAGSVGDYIRQLLAPRFSSNEEGRSRGSRWRPWDPSEFDEDAMYERVDGCDTYWRDVFGPALTRLTANQAINMLQGKPMLVLESPWHSHSTNYSTVRERMADLKQLTFQDLRVHWPPRQEEPESGSGSDGSAHSGRRRRRRRWASYDVYREMTITGWDETPVELREEWGREKSANPAYWSKPYDAWLNAEDSSLLVTTDSSCREATPQEYQQFERELKTSDTASTGDRFDMYLSFMQRMGPADAYVFLAPCVRRLTGRPKGTNQVKA